MLAILGLLIALTPFLGVPSSWRLVTTVVLGFAVVLVSLSLRHYLTRVSERLSNQSKANPVYVESVQHTQAIPSPVSYETSRPRSRTRRTKQTA